MNPLRCCHLFCLCLLMSPVAQAEGERPEVGPVAQVYSAGGSSLTVTLVRVGKREDGEYLIQFAGVDSEFNNRIIKHKCVLTEDKTDCYNEVMRPGREYYSFTGRSGWFSSQSYDAYLPDVPAKPIYVYYNRAASDAVNPEHFLTAYLQQSAE